MCKYYPVESKIHSMNPLAKLISMTLLIFISFSNTTIEFYVLLAILTILIILLTNIPIKEYAKHMKIWIPITTFLITINLIFQTPIDHIIRIIIRFTLMLSFFTILTATTKRIQIIKSLEQLLSPLKKFQINTLDLAYEITSNIYFFEDIKREKQRILKSSISRGNEQPEQLKTLFITKKEENLTIIKSKQIINHWNWFDNYMVIMSFTILLILI